MKFNNYGEYLKRRKILNIKLLPDIDTNYDKNKIINIAIIIPHRNRIDHLKEFILHFEKLEMQSNHHYHLYIIDQNNYNRFNRGILLNIGFYIASKDYNYDRYIFHDVDTYPNQILFELYFKFLDKNIHYSSPDFFTKYKFNNFFGGVLGISKNSFIKSGGFPLNVIGWGGEDDMYYNRCVINNILFYRPNSKNNEYDYALSYHDGPTINELNKYKCENILTDLKEWYKNGIKQLDTLFVNIKYFELDHFLETYNVNESNLKNNAHLLCNYKSEKQNRLLNIYKMDYLALHYKNKNNILSKDYVINKITERKNKLIKKYSKHIYQHKEQPNYMSVIEPLIYWKEIQEKIIDTYIKPNKFDINIEPNKRMTKIYNLLKNEFSNYKSNLDIKDLENTLKFIYDTYNEIIYIRIRNNKIECAYHIYNNSNTVDWFKNVTYKSCLLDKCIVNIFENVNKPYYTIKNPHFQPANNCLIGLDSYNYFEGNPNSYVNEFMEMINFTINQFINIPDCDLLINRKDFAYLRKDNKYSYDNILDEQIEIPLEKYFPIGCQSKKHINLDIPVPSSDEWISLKQNIKFTTKWEDKKNIAVFRGSSTGCGTTELNNPRIRLAKISYLSKKNILDVALTKLTGKIKIFKENIHIINDQENTKLVGSFIDGIEQSKYKYIFNIEGNAQAYRYSTEFKKKSVILNVKSDYYMWYDKLLVKDKHYIEIDDKFTNIESIIENINNGEEIVKNGYRFYKKYINKKMIANYWFYYMFNLNSLVNRHVYS